MEETHRVWSITPAPERSFWPIPNFQMGIVIDTIQEIGMTEGGRLVGLGRQALGLLAQPVETERLRGSELQAGQPFPIRAGALPEDRQPRQK
jgi:hypothetical protein